jgi:hypothetical protein
MTLDERLEALVMSTELLSRDVEALRATVEIDAAATAASIRDLRATVEIDANNIRALARIAEIHEHRLTGLEGTT